LGWLPCSNDCFRRSCDYQHIHYINIDPFGGAERLQSLPSRGAMKKGNRVLILPVMTLLLKDIKTLEDYARACLSREEERMVLVTREEAEVLESFRRFKNQDYD
jgi:hypothetical protein